MSAENSIRILFGENSFLQNLEYQKSKDHMQSQGDFNEEHFQAGQTPWKSIFDQANTYALMAPRQLFKVYMSKEFKDEDTLAWESYLKSPSNFTQIVVFAPKLDKRKKLTKLLQKEKLLEECPLPKLNEMGGWLSRFSKEKGLSFNAQAQAFILDYIGVDLGKLYHSLEQLLLFKHPATDISAQDIQTVLLQSNGEGLFSLIDCIFDQQKSKALDSLKFVLQNGDHPLIVLSLLMRHTRILMLCKTMQSSPPATLAKKAGIPPFAVKKYQQQAKALSGQKLYDLFTQLNTMDTQFKSSAVPARWQLEQFIIRI